MATKSKVANRFVYEHFDSVQDFEHVLATRKAHDFFGKRPSGRARDTSGWAGPDTWKESLELLKNGWNAPVEKIIGTLKQYQKKLESEKSVRIRDRVGFAPSVPDAIKGFPISMYNTKKEVVENPTIHIMYNMTGMSSFHAIQLLENSLTVLKMIMKLESEGKHVALDIVCKSSYDDYQDQYVMCSVRIKNGNQPMNLLKMAYPIANPGMFRRQGFAWLESQPEVEAYWSGYGVSLRHLDKDHKEEFWKNMPVDKKGLIYIDGEDCEDAGHDPIKLWENLSKK